MTGRGMSMKILLICNAGMSTSMLLQKMRKAAYERGLNVEIDAVPLSEGERKIPQWDVIMLGPQVRHIKSKLEKIADGKPVETIDMRIYGMMDGKAVLEKALMIADKNGLTY